MDPKDLEKVKARLETNPAKLSEVEADLSRAMVSLDETVKEKGRTEAEQYEKFEKQAKEIIKLGGTVDLLQRIQNAPSPSLPYGCTLQRAIQAPGFETRSLRGPMDAADEQVLDLQRTNDRLGIGLSLYRWRNRNISASDREIAEKHFPETTRRFMELRTSYAMDTAESGAGLDWLWTQYSPRLQERILLEMKVLAQFKDVVQMDSPTYTSPVLGTLTKAYFPAESTAGESQTAIPGVNLATSSATLNAKVSAGLTIISEQLSDASIVNIEQAILNDHPLQHAYAWDEAIISGDTSTTHMDTDTTTTTDGRKKVVGLRYIALHSTGGDQCLDCGTFEDDKFYRIEAAMGKYSMRPGAFWQTGIKGYFKIKRLLYSQGFIPAETLQMILKGATVGAVDYFHGKPIVVSEYQREDLDSTGIYNAAGTKAMIMLVCPEAFHVGNFQPLEIRVLDQVLSLYLQTCIRSTMARAFACKLAYASVPVVGAAINVDIVS